MGKHKEIKFRQKGGDLEGRQGNLIFRLYEDKDLTASGKRSFWVTVTHRDVESLGMSTGGYRYFTQDGAKEFCQGIAAGEIDPEALLAEFAMEDMEKEQAAIREITEKAKKFRDRLEAAGLSYMDLLELEALRHGLGEMGHEIMLGYYRGEGWPSGT